MEFSLFQELAGLRLFSWVSLACAAILIVVTIILVKRMSKKDSGAVDSLSGGEGGAMSKQSISPTRIIVYGALMVSLSFLLSYIKLFSMPQGGSITIASVLPLALFSQMFGFKRGLIVGAASGLLQFIQEPQMVHILQPFLDYILAFACFAFAGFFKRSLPLGIIVGGIGRIACSVVSGAVFFAEYAPPEMNPWIYSLGYNISVMGPDILICVIIAVLPPVVKMLNRIKQGVGIVDD